MTEASVPSPPPRPRLRRRWGQRCAALAIALVAALVTLELYGRYGDPFGIVYYREPNRYINEAIELLPSAEQQPLGRIFQNRAAHSLQLRHFRFDTNAFGLRAGSTSAPFSPARDDQRARILFLGDSVTLGWGVEDADTWIRRLERSERFVDGRALECLNAGHLLYDSVQEAAWLEAHATTLQPDVVVLTFVVNDVQDDSWKIYQDFLGSKTQPATLGLNERLRALAAVHLPGLYDLASLLDARLQAWADARNTPIPVEAQPGYAEGWARSSAALERVRARCAAVGARFVVFDHSTPRISALETWCAERAVPWFDFAFTAQEWARDVRVSLADPHANVLGQEILFGKARSALIDAGFLAAPPR